MKTGEFVRRHVPAIFAQCAAHDPAEFERLRDRACSKETFDLNFPFCALETEISATDQCRYWRDIYTVPGGTVRVTSQWFNPPKSRNLALFQRYLRNRGLATEEADLAVGDPSARSARGRYRGNAIGNAQNFLIRNILSRLGDEQFSAADWAAVKADFGHRCAYCGAEGTLVMDHVIPINREALGEHRLGNLVPACPDCNARKKEQDFRAFLSGDPTRIAAIESHMARRGYAPIEDRKRVREILALAHRDVRQLADHYLSLINGPREG